MVDTPKEGNGDNDKDPVEDKPPVIQPNDDVSGTALNHAMEKTAIPA